MKSGCMDGVYKMNNKYDGAKGVWKNSPATHIIMYMDDIKKKLNSEHTTRYHQNRKKGSLLPKWTFA